MIHDADNTSYRLQSQYSGNFFDDGNWMLEAPGEDKPSLLRAVYSRKQLNTYGDEQGLFKFRDWLPVTRVLQGSSAPVTYKSEGLSAKLGLPELYITFSGYWPEKGAGMKTCSFKETEAYPVCARLPLNTRKVLVVASAGNTARSFARVCSDNEIPLLLCVPEGNLDALWFDKPVNDYVRLIITPAGSDYYDAIHLSNLVSTFDRFIAEGGAKNVARRDGMGTTVLSAVTTIGRIPDYYFQAVGSGTGAIAAWEANLRLIEDGRFGNNKMKLIVSQNIPFTPMYDAWKAGSRELSIPDDEEARKLVEQIIAKVLSNRRPPYSVIGGLFDAMMDTGGEMLKVTNSDAIAATELFEQLEGIDIHPAAAVAAASLIQAVKTGKIDKDKTIMLNITGGGEKRFKEGKKLYYLRPSLVYDGTQETDELKDWLNRMF